VSDSSVVILIFQDGYVKERHTASVGFRCSGRGFYLWILFLQWTEVVAAAKRWQRQEIKAWKWQLVYTASGYSWSLQLYEVASVMWELMPLFLCCFCRMQALAWCSLTTIETFNTWGLRGFRVTKLHGPNFNSNPNPDCDLMHSYHLIGS